MRSSTVSSALETIEAAAEPSRLVIANGTLEALKWLGLMLMVADHTNKYCFREELPGVFAFGRVVMPLFGFILAYNLTRPGALERGVHRRVMVRLAIFGLIATPVCIALNASLRIRFPWWPLNILVTLFVVTLSAYLIERGGGWRIALAVLVALISGAFVEYLWPGIACCLGAWAFCRDSSAKGLLWWSLGTLALTLINGNAWALVAIPVLLAASHIDLPLPRSKWLFYAAYPAHLLGILVLKGLN